MSELSIRRAEADDANSIAPLLEQLGYPTASGVVRERMTFVREGDGDILLATRGDAVIGLATLFFLRVLHRPGPICRLTALVVEAAERSSGVGRRLVAEVEARARARGCVRVEVTSADDRTGAHAFYLRLGYFEKPKRFVKNL